jgi:hypothetical protein
MSDDQASFAARVIRLYLDHPDTPDMPSSSDWDIARGLADRGIPFDTIQLAFQLAFIRRNNPPSDTPLPPIHSLSYFRTVALNLTPEERDPAFVDYVRRLYEQLRASQQPTPPVKNRGEKPESRRLS